MPANRLSFALTDAYRERLNAVQDTIAGLARTNWTRLDPADLDASYPAWQTVTLAALRAAQGQAVSASSGYAGAFLISETGERTSPPRMPLGEYVGKSRDGRALSDALASPLIAIKAALGEGKDMRVALREGHNRARRILWLEVDYAATNSLLRLIDTDDRFDGWQRAVRGTCGACLGAATGPSGGLLFPKHESCFPAGTEVSGPPVEAASKRWYDGDLVELRFEGGGLLSCTPDHPILTPSGWVLADQLHEGDDVIRCPGQQRGMSSVHPDDDERPALIEEVAESVGCAGEVIAMAMPTAPENLYGDRSGGDIDVVRTDRTLGGAIQAPFNQQFGQVALGCGCAGLIVFAGLGAFDLLDGAAAAAASGGVGGFGVATAFLRRHSGSTEPLCLIAPSDMDSRLDEATADHDSLKTEAATQRKLGLSCHISIHNFLSRSFDSAGAAGYPALNHLAPERADADAALARRLTQGFAGEVELDRIIEFRRREFSGHVFNLQTLDHWYTANGIIVHNCQCVVEPRVGGVRDRYPRPTGAALFAAMSEAEQDEAVGAKAAELIRDGAISLEDLIGTSSQLRSGDHITQRPVSALG